MKSTYIQNGSKAIYSSWFSEQLSESFVLMNSFSTLTKMNQTDFENLRISQNLGIKLESRHYWPGGFIVSTYTKLSSFPFIEQTYSYKPHSIFSYSAVLVVMNEGCWSGLHRAQNRPPLNRKNWTRPSVVVTESLILTKPKM